MDVKVSQGLVEIKREDIAAVFQSDIVKQIEAADGEKTIGRGAQVLGQSYINATAAIQAILKAQNLYKGDIDGKFGDLTIAAVKEFQKQHGLKKIDGMVGSETLERLKTSFNLSSAVVPTSAPEATLPEKPVALPAAPIKPEPSQVSVSSAPAPNENNETAVAQTAPTPPVVNASPLPAPNPPKTVPIVTTEAQTPAISPDSDLKKLLVELPDPSPIVAVPAPEKSQQVAAVSSASVSASVPANPLPELTTEQQINDRLSKVDYEIKQRNDEIQRLQGGSGSGFITRAYESLIGHSAQRTKEAESLASFNVLRESYKDELTGLQKKFANKELSETDAQASLEKLRTQYDGKEAMTRRMKEINEIKEGYSKVSDQNGKVALVGTAVAIPVVAVGLVAGGEFILGMGAGGAVGGTEASVAVAGGGAAAGTGVGASTAATVGAGTASAGAATGAVVEGSTLVAAGASTAAATTATTTSSAAVSAATGAVVEAGTALSSTAAVTGASASGAAAAEATTAVVASGTAESAATGVSLMSRIWPAINTARTAIGSRVGNVIQYGRNIVAQGAAKATELTSTAEAQQAAGTLQKIISGVGRYLKTPAVKKSAIGFGIADGGFTAVGDILGGESVGQTAKDTFKAGIGGATIGAFMPFFAPVGTLRVFKSVEGGSKLFNGLKAIPRNGVTFGLAYGAKETVAHPVDTVVHPVNSAINRAADISAMTLLGAAGYGVLRSLPILKNWSVTQKLAEGLRGKFTSEAVVVESAEKMASGLNAETQAAVVNKVKALTYDPRVRPNQVPKIIESGPVIEISGTKSAEAVPVEAKVASRRIINPENYSEISMLGLNKTQLTRFSSLTQAAEAERAALRNLKPGEKLDPKLILKADQHIELAGLCARNGDLNLAKRHAEIAANRLAKMGGSQKEQLGIQLGRTQDVIEACEKDLGAFSGGRSSSKISRSRSAVAEKATTAKPTETTQPKGSPLTVEEQARRLALIKKESLNRSEWDELAELHQKAGRDTAASIARQEALKEPEIVVKATESVPRPIDTKASTAIPPKNPKVGEPPTEDTAIDSLGFSEDKSRSIAQYERKKGRPKAAKTGKGSEGDGERSSAAYKREKRHWVE